MTKFKKMMITHWKALSLIAIVALALVSVVYAYWKNNTPTASQPATSTTTSYPLELRMDLDKTEFQRGEAIKSRGYLKNISNRTVQIYAKDGVFNFKITAEDGTIIYLRSRYWYQFIPAYPEILKPGMNSNHTLLDASVPDSKTLEMVPIQLAKGTYKAIVFTNPMAVEYVEPSRELIGTDVVIETPPVEITIA